MKVALLMIGLILTTTLLNAEGKIESLSQYDYWDNGNIRKREVFDLKGYLRIKANFRTDGTASKVERYDSHGNRIEEVFLNEKGKLAIGIDGWAAMRWKYEDSHLISQVSYDENGEPLERMLFSGSGRLIARQYAKDVEIDPYEFANTLDIIRKNREAAAKELENY